MTKKHVAKPGLLTIQMDFRVVENATYEADADGNATDVLLSPPHWEIWNRGAERPWAWGDIGSTPAMMRLLGCAKIANDLLPPDLINNSLRAMGLLREASKIVLPN